MGLKLYRGLAAEEFELLSQKAFKESRKTWIEILYKRAKGDFSYPLTKDKEIQRLHKITRLERQHFTDNLKIAKAYAKKTKGMLIQIEVSPERTAKYFRLEFQNFGLRKKQFEIVYVVDSHILAKHQNSWKLKILNLQK